MPILRSFFIALSTNRSIRAFSEKSSAGRAMSRRFVAGMSVPEALAACKRLNDEGIAVSLDSLGESVTTEAEAMRSAAIYFELLDAIREHGLNANVSVKLTQMGMNFSPALAERIVGQMVERADGADSFVRVDMEGSELTEPTVALTERLHAKWPGRVGTVLQAYLFRTEYDAARLLRQRIRIRLCKGAYQEPPELAYPKKEDVDANYVRLMQGMVTSGVFCGIATHDEAIVNALREFVAKNNVPKTAFEFQMLYGIRRDLQRQLVGEGFRVAGLCSVWDGMVSILYAATGGTACECGVPGEKLLQAVGRGVPTISSVLQRQIVHKRRTVWGELLSVQCSTRHLSACAASMFWRLSSISSISSPQSPRAV